MFQRVRRLDPGNAEADRYLGLLQAREPAPRPAPPRPPLTRPDTLELPARAFGDHLEVRTDTGWARLYIKAIDLGAALPGHFATQFPDSATYARWLDGMAATGANAVRVYTRHPPAFYEALADHDARHPDHPLWLMQGVWADLPPDGTRYADPAWQGEFLADVGRAIDIIHGRADIAPKPGMASGHYAADVSRWTLAIILGREWEATSVIGFDRLRPDFTAWAGTYATATGASPMEAWLTMVVDSTVAIETRRYNTQRPVSYTNWPTTDPLRHPTEATSLEEAAILRGLGDGIDLGQVMLEGEDAVTIDPGHTRATGRFPAGFFATYHVYPYYPDFMTREPAYLHAVSPWGPSNYFGYLTALKRYHRDIPVFIGEYGLPPSIGVSHVAPFGWHHGGLTEARAAAGTARLTREIAAAGMAGGGVFEWIDEWFKKTWVTQQFESPPERDRMWYNRLDSEEHFGLNAVEPEPRIRGETLAERVNGGWLMVRPAYDDSTRGTLRLLADEAYLRVLYVAPRRVDEVLLGFDVIDPRRGDSRWPGKVGPRLPVGLEVVLRARGDTARILKDTHSQPIRIRELPAAPIDSGPDIASPPPGFFRGRFVTVGRLRIHSRLNDDGVYEPPRLVFSRRMFARDSTEFAALGYDAGLLPNGPGPDGLWQTNGTAWEFRIPWQLLDVGDPSQLLVLQDTLQRWRGGPLETVPVDAIRVLAAARTRSGDWLQLPASNRLEDVASFSWATWEEPKWQARPRPVLDSLREAWSGIPE